MPEQRELTTDRSRFLFEAIEKGKVNEMGKDFTMKDMLEKYKKTYKKGVSWDKKGYGGF